MIQVGEMVMVRDPAITEEYHVPPAKVVEVRRCPVLLTTECLLEFDNGKREWFNTIWLKKE